MQLLFNFGNKRIFIVIVIDVYMYAPTETCISCEYIYLEWNPVLN